MNTDEPSDTYESQPQSRINNIIKEVNVQYEYTSPGRENMRSPDDIYNDISKNKEKIDFDIYN